MKEQIFSHASNNPIQVLLQIEVLDVYTDAL